MDLKKAEKIAKALGDNNRLRILQEIKKKQGCLQCMEIYPVMSLAQPSISHHLKQLVEADLVIAEKEGRNVKYALNQSVLDEYIHFLDALKSIHEKAE